MKFLENYELFLFDLDGVVYTDDKPTRGAVESINKIKANKKKVLFITNKTRIFRKIKEDGDRC